MITVFEYFGLACMYLTVAYLVGGFAFSFMRYSFPLTEVGSDDWSIAIATGLGWPATLPPIVMTVLGFLVVKLTKSCIKKMTFISNLNKSLDKLSRKLFELCR